ncbi:hypothetical protein TWF132_006140 [Orbilia oligospora]|nr:hypothetical protein TWF132_006140 [Orbilia oligospora]
MQIISVAAILAVAGSAIAMPAPAPAPTAPAVLEARSAAPCHKDYTITQRGPAWDFMGFGRGVTTKYKSTAVATSTVEADCNKCALRVTVEMREFRFFGGSAPVCSISIVMFT